MKTIIHIDFDSFFASVEQQYNPEFRNKPTGVIAHHSRSCIIAASREAKKLGIKTGTRSFEAERICPSIILVPADFVKYFEISKKFLNICKDYSPFVELFSIDEVFMDITKTNHLFGGTMSVINHIKNRIKKEIGEYITASVGISHNKLLAKIASGINKPDGIFEIKTGDIDKVYGSIKLTDVCGIGEQIKLRLNRIGIHSLLQLRNFPYSALVSEFGNVEAEFLKNVSFGHDSSDIIPYTSPTEIKSVGRNYCLARNEYNWNIVLQNFYELCEEVGIKLRRTNKKARTLGFSLRGNVNIHARKTYTDYFDSGKEIFDKCISQPELNNFVTSSRARNPHKIANQERDLSAISRLRDDNHQKNYIRQISVWVSNLENKDNLTLPLFDFSIKNERLTTSVDEINEKFGDHTIRKGFLLHADKLTTVPNGFSKGKDVELL